MIKWLEDSPARMIQPFHNHSKGFQRNIDSIKNKKKGQRVHPKLNKQQNNRKNRNIVKRIKNYNLLPSTFRPKTFKTSETCEWVGTKSIEQQWNTLQNSEITPNVPKHSEFCK